MDNKCKNCEIYLISKQERFIGFCENCSSSSIHISEPKKRSGRPKDRFVNTKKAEPSKPVRIPLSKLKEVDELIKKKS